MTSVQERRLRDLNFASLEWVEPTSAADARRQLGWVGDAIAAGQSLDDLGSPEANDAAWKRIAALLDRYKRIEAWLAAQGSPRTPQKEGETLLIPAPYALLRDGIPVTVRAQPGGMFSGIFVSRHCEGITVQTTFATPKGEGPHDASVGPSEARYVITVNLSGVSTHLLRERDKVLVDLLLRPVRDEATSAIWVAMCPNAPPLFTAPIFYREQEDTFVMRDPLGAVLRFWGRPREGSRHVPAIAEVERAGGPVVAALAAVIAHVLGGTP